MASISPLRYPGGKGKIANFIKHIILQNDLRCVYVEPYAGGAGVACDLLLSEIVNKIIINDASLAIYAFWYSVINFPEDLCRLIKDTPVNVRVWHKQQEIQQENSPDMLELGFSTFFLNRTNVSGILKGGVIGGLEQKGNYLIDARYHKKNLIKRIMAIAKYAGKIELYNEDAMSLLDIIEINLPEKSLIYFDPPYFIKGKGLYRNFYNKNDHENIANKIINLKLSWIISYDNVPQIREMYPNIKNIIYDITYSARRHYNGNEIIYFSDDLEIPECNSPIDIKNKDIVNFLSNAKSQKIIHVK